MSIPPPPPPPPPSQVADETGQVQYATQTVTVTDRDAKALGQPVGSTTTVLLTAYPGGHSGAMESTSAAEGGAQQFLAQTASAAAPNVQVVYSASHIESVPDSVVSSIASLPTPSQTHGTFTQGDKSTSTPTHRMNDTTGTEYLNLAASQAVMVSHAEGGGGSHAAALEGIAEHDLASQLINEYVGSEGGGVATPTSGGGLQTDAITT